MFTQRKMDKTDYRALYKNKDGVIARKELETWNAEELHEITVTLQEKGELP